MKIRIFRDHTHEGELTKADPVNGTEIDLPEDAAKQVLAAEGERRAEIVKESKRIQKIQETPAESIE